MNNLASQRPAPFTTRTGAGSQHQSLQSAPTQVRMLAVIGLGALGIAAIAASLLLGSNTIAAADVWASLVGRGEQSVNIVVLDQRLPRTVVVICVGAALGVAGALMQALTRNPLADPGILGINAGSSLAVVLAVVIGGALGITTYIWWAFLGAILASIGVYILGGVGRQYVTPARLTLAGVAFSMAISAFVQTLLLSNQQAFNEFRYWATGSVEGRGWDVAATISGFILVGIILAFLAAPALNALALGDDTGLALGVKIARTRTIVMVAVTLLCGAATAAVGPIMFVGLAVPYLARAIGGVDQRKVIPLCLLAAPTFLLCADVLARIIVAPLEIQTGIMSALVGAPIFIAVVRSYNLETSS